MFALSMNSEIFKQFRDVKIERFKRFHLNDYIVQAAANTTGPKSHAIEVVRQAPVPPRWVEPLMLTLIPSVWEGEAPLT